VVGFSRLRRRGRIDASGRALLTLRARMMLPRANVSACHYQHEAPASVSPCEVLQPEMRPLLALRAGILAPGSGVWAHADTSTKRPRVFCLARSCNRKWAPCWRCGLVMIDRRGPAGGREKDVSAASHTTPAIHRIRVG
jgi:hypothetical protein